MKYERLTETKKINEYCSTVECGEHCEDCYVGKLYERLAELEDKIEQGTLIELPCKVGDTIFWVSSNNRDIIEVIVNSIRLVKDRIILFVEEKGVGEYTIMFVDDIFLTKAEAEQKLKELKEE